MGSQSQTAGTLTVKTSTRKTSKRQRNDVKLPRQAKIILAELQHKNKHATAQEIFFQLRNKKHSIGIATVYRSLNTLLTLGLLDTITQQDQTLYRACSNEHHHHIICTSCNTSIEIIEPSIEECAAKSATKHNFILLDHEFEIYGLCKTCKTSTNQKKPKNTNRKSTNNHAPKRRSRRA